MNDASNGNSNHGMAAMATDIPNSLSFSNIPLLGDMTIQITESTTTTNPENSGTANNMNTNGTTEEGLNISNNNNPASGNNNNTPLDLNNIDVNLMQQYSRLSYRYKFLIPFCVLILLKTFLDHIISFVLLVLFMAAFKRLKQHFQHHLALKNQSTPKAWLSILGLNISLLSSTLLLLKYLNYTQRLPERLILYSVRFAPDELSSLQIIWDCVVTDIIIQLGIVLLKVIVCIVVDLMKWFSFQWRKRRPGNDSPAPCTVVTVICERLKEWFQQKATTHTASTTTTMQNSDSRDRQTQEDLEQGGRSSMLSTSQSLARRTNSTAHTSAPLAHTNSSQNLLDTSDENISDSSVAYFAETDYLWRLRIISLIDIVGYTYRSCVPFPIWFEYFSVGNFGSKILSVLFLAMKLYDVMWKLKGATEAIDHFINNKLEFGHYANTEEYNEHSSSYDCPICFDAPKKPIVLQCTHIFCEVCICEWLDKEKTCPVCRAEIVPTSKLLQQVKQEAQQSNIVII